MHIIYAVTTCSDRVYRQLFADAPRKPAFQSQKYHRLLIEGLAAGAKVDVVANPPVNREVLKKSFVRLPRETEGGACYRYIPAVRNPIVKAVFVGVGTFFRTARLAGKDSAVVVDCLNRTTALAGLLSLALRNYLGKDEIQYSYSADTRREAGVPDALYNCVCSFQSGVKLNDDTRLADIVPGMDAFVRRSLQPEVKLQRMAEQMSWVYKVDRQKAPLRIKQRVFQMGEYISGVSADFWLSYLGNPLLPATPELQKYTKDFNVWVPPDGGSMGVEASSLNGIITLCIENKAEMPGLAGMIRTAFEKEDITVLEAVDLDT